MEVYECGLIFACYIENWVLGCLKINWLLLNKIFMRKGGDRRFGGCRERRSYYWLIRSVVNF